MTPRLVEVCAGLQRAVASVLWVLALLPAGPSAADTARLARAEEAYQAGDYARSATLLQAEVAERLASKGERDADTLTAQSALARSELAWGRTSEALALNEKVLSLRTEVLGERHPDTLASMNNLARTYSALGRTGDDLALTEKVVKLRTEVLGERHPDTLASMGNLALAYGAMGRNFEQLATGEQVLKLRTEVLGERHPDTLTSMSNVAIAFGAVGRTADALALNERVLKVRLETLGERHPDTITSMMNLAISYAVLGRTAEQVAQFEKVLKLRTEVLGERHPRTLSSMSNLAITYGELGRTAEQLALNEKVVKLRTEILGERHPDTLSSMSDLAIAYGEAGRTAEQLALNEQVLKLRTEVLGERHPDTLRSTYYLALNYGDVGRTAEQITLNEKAVRLQKETLGERHPKTLSSMEGLAELYSKLDRKADAAALAAAFVSGAEWQRSQPGLSTASRQAVFEGYAKGYRFFSAIHGGLGQIEQGFRLSELGKARTLLESMSVQQAVSSGALPVAEQAALEALNRQSAALENQLARTRGPEASQSLESDRNELARRYEALQNRLKAQYPKYAQLSEPHLVAVADLPGLLPQRTVAVSYVIHKEGLAAWLVDPRGRVRFADLGHVPNLDDAVAALRLASASSGTLRQALAAEQLRAWRLKEGSYGLLDAGKPPPEGAVEVEDIAEIANWLSARLLDPLARDLADVPHWVLSPDGVLAQVPFELLSLRGRRVLDRHQIHYTQSISTYALSRARQHEYAGLRRQQDLLAFGNPEYRADGLAEPSRQARAASLNVRSLAELSDTRDLWRPLPGTEAEVQALRRIFRSGQTLTRAQASEARLIALNATGALKDFRYLHFATHGLFSAENPALSSIVLSQVNLPAGTDGFVTAAKWPAYELRSDMVVLSACETGLGKNLSGEGVMGLPFALFVAGNIDTVVSLWPVDDIATALFMQTFYARIHRGQSAAQALAETKRTFAGHPRFHHPRFWAAFVLIGAG